MMQHISWHTERSHRCRAVAGTISRTQKYLRW
jgi:hypothetical protein